MPAYELRSGGDARNKKQSVAELKYRRLTELNTRLKEDLDRPRVKVSEASLSYAMPLSFDDILGIHADEFSLINYCSNTRDFMVPSVWGQVCFSPSVLPGDMELTLMAIKVDKREDPYAPQQQGGCCTVM